MRVTAGTAKSIQLETLDGRETRPTTGRIKETLFNIIQLDVPNCIFLDLYSGSGAIGIEALSRGAKKAYFVDNNPDAVKCIKRNLKRTNLEDGSVVLQSDVLGAIHQLDVANVGFDIIFMDPPYNCLYEKNILTALEQSNLINDDSIVIVETSLKTDIDYLDNTSLYIYREKKYKTNKHIFIRRNIGGKNESRNISR